MRFCIAIAMISLNVSTAVAQGKLSARIARQIIDGCVSHATRKNQSHAIAVYDDGGHPIALLRMDGNAPGVADFAMRKAAAVAHWRFSTADMAEAARTTPGFDRAPHVVTVAGGVPIFAPDGREFLGAVGVSGESPGDDVACAEAGIAAAGFLTKRK